MSRPTCPTWREIITGRNEVLAKVIFSQACVKNSVHSGGGGGGYPSMPCKSVPGGLQFFGGVSNFGGSPILGGVEGGLRGTPQFFGGGNFFSISAFFGNNPPPGPDTRIRSTLGRYASYWNAFLLHVPAVAALQAFQKRC